jgi:hypothetical protein
LDFWNSIDFIQQSNNPTIQQSNNPTIQQSNNPTIQQSNNPTIQQSNNPTIQQSNNPREVWLSNPDLNHYKKRMPDFARNRSQPIIPKENALLQNQTI